MAVLKEWVMGRHSARLEEPDVLVVKVGGPAALEDAKVLTALYREVGSQRPVYAIVDVSESDANAEARSYYARELRQEWFHAIIYIGTGVTERAVGKAMAGALYFTGKWTSEFLYVDSMEEAREAVARLRAKKAPPG